MAVIVEVTVLAPDDVLTEYDAGALVRLESSSDEDGPFVEIATSPVVAGQFFDEIADPSGTTDTWYRIRYSDALGSSFSTYGDPFTPGQPAAYATLDDYLLTTKQAISDPRSLANANRKLIEATNDLDEAIGYSFFRLPRSGTQERVYSGDGTNRLHIHEGVVAIDKVELQPSLGSDYLEIDAADWYLEAEPDNPTPTPGDPYFHVVLQPLAAYRRFQAHPQSVRLTIATGWPAVKTTHREATIAWARQRIGLEGSMPGGAVGPDEYGQPVTYDRKPQVVYDLIRRESLRHFACSM